MRFDISRAAFLLCIALTLACGLVWGFLIGVLVLT